MGNVAEILRKYARTVLRPASPLHEPLIEYSVGGTTAKAHATWYRGEYCNYYPRRANLAEGDAIGKYITLGWSPPQPFIGTQDYITAFGSCFAQHVTKYLLKEGYSVFGGDLGLDAYVIRCGEGMVNTAAIAQQFRWAYGEVEFDQSLWHDKDGQAAEYLDSVRGNTRAIFEQTDVFIITLGLSEVWYDKQTGDIFWRTIPKRSYDPSRHGFKVMDVAENKANLATVYRVIREHRPSASIILTLSPVPLAATFRPVSCITANSVSKAVLRVAIDEFKREREDDARLFYFPAYEIAKEFFLDPYGDDLRHVRPEVVATIMRAFHVNFLI